jgi:hypothetical protein
MDWTERELSPAYKYMIREFLGLGEDASTAG